MCLVNQFQRNLRKDYFVFSFLFVCVKIIYSCSASSASFITFLLPLLWEGTNKSSFLWTGDLLCTFYYFIRFLHSGHGDILCTCSFLFMKVTLFCFPLLTSQDLFASCLFIIYSFGKPVLHIFGPLLLHRHNYFLTLCLAGYSEIWQEENK